MQPCRLSATIAVVLSLTAAASQAQSRGPVMPSYTQSASGTPAPAPAPAATAAATEDSIDLVGPTDAQKARADAAMKAKADADAAAKVQAEADAKARAEAEARAKIEVEIRARVEAEAKARAEAEVKARAESEAKARAEAEARARAEAAAKAQEAAAAQARAEADAKLQAAAQAKADDAARAQAASDAKAAAAAAKIAGGNPPARTVAAPVPAAGLPLDAPAAPSMAAAPTEEGNAELVAAPARRVITPGALAPALAPTPVPPAQGNAAAPSGAAAPAPAAAVASPAAQATATSYGSASAPVPAAPSVAPGLVDAAARMHAQESAPCKSAKGKKHRKAKSARDNCTTDLPLPEVDALSAKQSKSLDQLPLASLDSSAHGVVVAMPPSQGAFETAPGTRVASNVVAPGYGQHTLLPDPIDARPSMATPNDERTQSRARAIRVTDELLVGPSGLLENSLSAGGDLLPDAVVGAFTYRYLVDDAGAAHHGFFLSAGGAPCDDAGACSLRASGLVGFSPTGSNAYGVNAGGAARSDSLGWSSLYLGANLKGRTGSGYGFEVGAQLQNLSLNYAQNAASATPTLRDASLAQLKLSAAGSVQSGGLEGRLLVEGNAYLSGDTATTVGVPLRGVFFDTEISGFTSAPQGLFAKLEGRYSFSTGTTATVSYGYLTYAGPQWASAHVFNARVAQQLGRFQLGAGLTEQLDAPTTMPAGASLGDYSSTFVHAFFGATF